LDTIRAFGSGVRGVSMSKCPRTASAGRDQGLPGPVAKGPGRPPRHALNLHTFCPITPLNGKGTGGPLRENGKTLCKPPVPRRHPHACCITRTLNEVATTLGREVVQ
jgi:hypothetical protein